MRGRRGNEEEAAVICRRNPTTTEILPALRKSPRIFSVRAPGQLC